MFSIGDWRKTRNSLLGLLLAAALLVIPPSQTVEGGLPQLESAGRELVGFKSIKRGEIVIRAARRVRCDFCRGR